MTSPHHEPYFRTASETAGAVRSGSVSATEATQAALSRVSALNDALRAFITIDEEGALKAARAVDEARAAGRDAGILAGVPVAIKDLAATKGLRTTYGSLVYADHVPDEDELVVARLRAQGAIVIGKTNTPEFGYGAICENKLYGPTCNPFDVTRTSGGSSGGSAVAVATGMTALGHATDFGGSARVPASFCGVYGIRPTVGLIPSVPKQLLWDGLNQHGFLARTPGDVALALAATAGPDRRDPLSLRGAPFAPALESQAPDELRVGVSASLGITPVDSSVLELFETAIGKIAGIWRETRPGHPDCSEAKAAFGGLRAGFLHRTLGPVVAAHRDKLTRTVIWNVERGHGMSADDYLGAEEARSRLYLNFMRFFETHDILATVTTTLPPFPNDQSDVLYVNGEKLENIIDYLSVTFTISTIGFPALSVPIGLTREGLPVGMQLVAPPWREDLLLAVAERLRVEAGMEPIRP
ncbi:MAG: amidase [Salinarimonadaceae bacterium]|nr:MAG: amidase [Salinarimonadaceae bacterium]